MELTREIVSRFVGGQLEAQSPNEDYVYRGEISNASMIGTGESTTLFPPEGSKLDPAKVKGIANA